MISDKVAEALAARHNLIIARVPVRAWATRRAHEIADKLSSVPAFGRGGYRPVYTNGEVAGFVRRGKFVPLIQGASRDADRVFFRHAPGTISADTIAYFSHGEERPLLFRRSHLILVTAGSDEDETVDSDWAYNTVAAPTTWTAIVAGATIDVGGAALTAAALALQNADAGAALDIRVPAESVLRNTLDVAGTTPSFNVVAVGEGTVL